MDKYEYRTKTDQMLTYIEHKQFGEAVTIADTIDWRRVRNVTMLCAVSDAYERSGRLDKGRELIILAFERSPDSRKIVYRWGMLALKMGLVGEAMDCYEEFISLAPRDPNQYILKYKILKIQGAEIGKQIDTLVEFKKVDYSERWAYELAKLYHEAGKVSECLAECDDLILWFGDNKYVYRAMEIKMHYKPLTPAQQQKYDAYASKHQRPQMNQVNQSVIAPVQMKTLEEIKNYKKAEAPVVEPVQPQVFVPPVVEQAQPQAFVPPITESVQPQAFVPPITEPVQPQTFVPPVTEPVQSQTFVSPVAEPVQVEPLVMSSTPIGTTVLREDETAVPTDKTIRFDASEIAKAAGLKGAPIQPIIPQPVTTVPTSVRKSQIDETTGKLRIDEILAEWEGKQKEVEDAMIQGRKKVVIETPQELSPEIQQLIDVIEGKEPYEDIVELGIDDLVADTDETAEEQVQESPEESDNFDVLTEGELLEESEESEEDWEEPVEENVESEETEEELVEENVDSEEVEEELVEENMDSEEVEEELVEESVDSEETWEEPVEENVDSEETEEELVEENVESEETEEELVEECEDLEEAEEMVETTPEVEEGTTSSAGDTGEWVIPFHDESSEKEAIANEEIDNLESDIEGMLEGLEEDLELEESFEKDVEDIEGMSEVEEFFDEDETYHEYDNGLKADESFGDENDFMEDDDERMQVLEEEKEAPTRMEKAKAVATGKTAKLPTAEIAKAVAAGGSIGQDTGFIVQARYDLDAQSEVGLRAGLTEDQKKLFSYFVPVRGMSEQLVEVLEKDEMCKDRYGTSKTGNLLVIGRKGSGKTVLAVDVVKAIQKNRHIKQGKVAIVTGESLNKKKISDIVDKLYGGALIIEKANGMSEKTIVRLNKAMERETGEMLVVLEDERKPLDRVLTMNMDFRKKFTSRLEVPIFINDELVTFAQTYAKENGYKIDEMGILALYSQIDTMQREESPVTVAVVKDIMDEAINHSRKLGVKKIAKRLFGKGLDESKRIILTEKNFNM